jgi:hypothetical protein
LAKNYSSRRIIELSSGAKVTAAESVQRGGPGRGAIQSSGCVLGGEAQQPGCVSSIGLVSRAKSGLAVMLGVIYTYGLLKHR